MKVQQATRANTPSTDLLMLVLGVPTVQLADRPLLNRNGREWDRMRGLVFAGFMEMSYFVEETVTEMGPATNVSDPGSLEPSGSL